MPHFTTYGGSRITVDPKMGDFTTSQLQLTRNYLDGDFNDVVFHSKHDPLTGYSEAIGLDSSTLELNENLGGTAGPGGSTFLTENISGTSGPGGTSFPVQTFEPLAVFNSFGEAPKPVFEVSGTAGPGGSTFLTENVLGSTSHGGDDI